jgi:hypothetical protein
MILVSERNVSLGARPYLPKFGTGGSAYQHNYGQLLNEENVSWSLENDLDDGPNLRMQQIGICQNGTKTSNYFVVGVAIFGFCATGASCLKLPPPEEVIWKNNIAPSIVGFVTPISTPEPVISQAEKLIGEVQAISDLPLEMVAPLLGVSRRSIQYWKDGGKISFKNELQLNNLVGVLKQISTGNSSKTRGLLLERIPGVPRIYDLLAEQRYDTAISRAKNPTNHKPIPSDPTIKFDHRPIEDQLAIVDDVAPTNGFKLNRAMSRRLPIKS